MSADLDAIGTLLRMAEQDTPAGDIARARLRKQAHSIITTLTIEIATLRVQVEVLRARLIEARAEAEALA